MPLLDRQCAKERPMCHACGGVTFSMYAVYNSVWLKAMPGLLEHEHLHLECLERKLGRFLSIADFPYLPVNYQIFFGLRLAVGPKGE